MTSFLDIHKKEPSLTVPSKSDRFGIFYRAKFETAFQVTDCSVTKILTSSFRNEMVFFIILFISNSFTFYQLSGPNWGAILTGMTAAESGIGSNRWKPRNGKEKKPESHNYLKPISGEGIPETMFKAAKKQDKKIKVHLVQLVVG